MDIDANDLISGLKAQRNDALDNGAQWCAAAQKLERENAELNKRIAELEKPRLLHEAAE